jgi:hypothetical protein
MGKAFANSSSEKRLISRIHKVLKSSRKGMGIVAPAYNPSYLGRGDQEDCDSRPAWAKS